MKIKLILACICFCSSFGWAADSSAQPSAAQGGGYTIKLNDEWRFATDKDNRGTRDKWYADNYNDSGWKILKSGSSWQSQGVAYHGWAWYRQKLVIPADCRGIPLTLALADIPADDEVFLNGVRIGGIEGEYKYANLALRTYTAPASIVRYGQPNTIAIRAWGGNIGFIGEKSGLVGGPYKAELNPYVIMAREKGGADGSETSIQLFDLTDAQRGKPFELVFRFPKELLASRAAKVQYILADWQGKSIATGDLAISAGKDGFPRAVAAVDGPLAQTIYLRGRFKATLTVSDDTGKAVYHHTLDADHLSFDRRDTGALPALPETVDETPYGKLKLVDDIDCSKPLGEEQHPYLQSGFDKSQARCSPGSAVDVSVTDILGKKARESSYGWFAYRVGRGKLKPHTNYLVRIEYPEDKPRYCPIEIQNGHSYMDIGWKSGVSADDPYDNWPLSKKWQWYDVIFSLDDMTTGTGGTGSASSEEGVWVYFINKVKPGLYFALYQGGPAISRIKLYEVDPERNAPVINKPQGEPQRVLMVDWERGADQPVEDTVRYCKLMGYSAVSPIMLKWAFANYADPEKGYDSTNIDAQKYTVYSRYDPKTQRDPGPAVPGVKSVHEQYLAATKRYGVNYIPRFEYGGSMDLPVDARATGPDGKPAKPNRFAEWCADLLAPATWNDLAGLMDHLIKPYVRDNPQLTGALWRIRCDRMPISYSYADLNLFANETKTPLPSNSDKDLAAWASSGEGAERYSNWWHQKRMQFHVKLLNLLKSYRPDLSLYYFNWEEDKWGIILPDLNSWGFLGKVATARGGTGREVFEQERAERKRLTGEDYVNAVRTGNFGKAYKGGNRTDYGLRPDLYKDVKGLELFAPIDYLYLADNPAYLNYFQTGDGLAVSNIIPYDEVDSRMLNPKYEANTVTPGGPAFSMALELLAYFHGDARTLTYTTYTYGRGFAAAHRRFAQAFLALPAIPGTVVDQDNNDVKVRAYPSHNGTYVGVAYKGYANGKFTVKVPAGKMGTTVKNLVTGEVVPASVSGGQLQFELATGPMELNAFLIQ